MVNFERNEETSPSERQPYPRPIQPQAANLGFRSFRDRLAPETLHGNPPPSGL